MKILVYSDNHWCQYSSILRKRGDVYSYRLENQIKSINWAEDLARTLNCKMIVHCGDFFDKESLNSEEITALKELNFEESVDHLMLVGNHEIGLRNNFYSSSQLFGLKDAFLIIDKPKTIELDDFHQLCFLPYDIDSNDKLIEDIFPKTPKTRIIFSHNDLSGIQLGQFITKSGFKLDNIEDNCDLFINGHIHNGQRLSKKIFNIGNLTGQNFSEDGFTYPHSVFVIDTSTLEINVYDNPYAINFYKIDFSENNSIDYINQISSQLKNAIITIKCLEEDREYLQKRFGNIPSDIVPKHSSIIESRFIVIQNQQENNSEDAAVDLSVDHQKEFKKYILSEYGSNEIILNEIEEIFK